MFVNSRGLNLGRRQNGVKLNDIVLPPVRDVLRQFGMRGVKVSPSAHKQQGLTCLCVNSGHKVLRTSLCDFIERRWRAKLCP